MRLNEVCDQKQNTLSEKKVALDQLSRLTDHCILFGTHALKKGSDMELLYSKKYTEVIDIYIHLHIRTQFYFTIMKKYTRYFIFYIKISEKDIKYCYKLLMLLY